ncbi:hypothetical protein LX83_001108 [Goodfellowiella coeruleoviolacea]|uniref:Transposase n=1 Tax=Goodfellowiella coeruleoviolacea TaxID=334858 RepID=A0AAE3GAL0_9PSEU|nr:hypothetical protein [Goodfellowiella coeruleoviolacea]
MIGKRVNGRTYYYLVESGRVDGRPRIVAQRYLGSAEDIVAALDGAGAVPASTRQLSFGDVAAVWATLERLQLARVVDEVVGRGRGRVSVGNYLALAVLHRATAPATSLAEWWANTAARRFVRPRPPADAVRDELFWRATARLTGAHLDRVEQAVAASVWRWLGPARPSTLTVDVPGFATYAETETAAATPTGLTVLVTRDGAIPLTWHAYRRDSPGLVPFGAVAERLATRHRAAVGETSGTLVFDASQHAQLDLDADQRFVGALPLGDHPELLARPASARTPVDPDRFAGLTALDTRASVFGVRRRVVLTHSARLHAAQARGLAQALSSATRQLDGLARALAEGRNRRPRDQLRTEIARITRVRWVDRVLTARLTGDSLDWRIDQAALARLGEEFFGKQLLVTNHDDWPVADVITAHRARYHLDSTFRMLNGGFVAAPTPGAHWTDQRIAVHTLVTMLTTAVTHLMRREADRAGLDLSVRELLEQLAQLGETVLRYPSTGGRPPTRHLLTSRDATQQQLFDLFGLAALAPR